MCVSPQQLVKRLIIILCARAFEVVSLFSSLFRLVYLPQCEEDATLFLTPSSYLMIF